MKTTYLPTLHAVFNPFSRTAIVPRLFLSLLPANVHKTVQVKTTQLPKTTTQPASLELRFKDGKTMKYSWPELSKEQIAASQDKPARIEDIVAEVERHARIAGRKEELAG